MLQTGESRGFVRKARLPVVRLAGLALVLLVFDIVILLGHQQYDLPPALRHFGGFLPVAAIGGLVLTVIWLPSGAAPWRAVTMLPGSIAFIVAFAPRIACPFAGGGGPGSSPWVSEILVDFGWPFVHLGVMECSQRIDLGLLVVGAALVGIGLWPE